MNLKCNFDVTKGIKEFTLKDFLSPRKLSDSIGGYLLITNKQCVMGYNDDNGRASHVQAFASAIKEIMDLNDMDFHQMMDIDMKTDEDFIKGRLVNMGNWAYIAFNFALLESITSNQLALFEEFKNQYNDVIKFYSHYYGRPVINYIIPGYLSYEDYDLENVYNYLKTIVNDKKILMDDHNIIGEISLQSKVK